MQALIAILALMTLVGVAILLDHRRRRSARETLAAEPFEAEPDHIAEGDVEGLGAAILDELRKLRLSNIENRRSNARTAEAVSLLNQLFVGIVIVGVACILLGFGWYSNYRRAQDRDAESAAQNHQRIVQDCRNRNQGRQTTIEAILLGRDGFKQNSESLLAAAGFNPDDPAVTQEERDAFKIYMTGQDQILARYDEKVAKYRFDDCDGDGDIDAGDGYDIDRPPYREPPAN